MKISIITATYNSGRTISDTMESILMQTFKDIEYIVVDGASTDNTMEIVRSYEKRFGGKMKYASEADKGLYDAMNKGIELATGDIIGILNSDDYYTAPDILEQVAQRLEDKSIDAVYGDLHYIYDDKPEKCVRYYSSKWFRPSLMLLGYIPAHPTFYCRKELYQIYGKYNISYTIAADFEQLLRLIYIHRIKTCYIPIDFVTMRMGGVSTANLGSRWLGMKDHRRALKSNGVYCSYILLNLLFIYKIFEILVSPIRYRKSLKRLQHLK